MLLPLLHLFNDGYLAAMPLILPFAAAEFSIPLSVVGLLGSLLSFSGIILALPAGMAATRFGAIRILGSAVLCYGLGFLLLGFSQGLPMIFAAFSDDVRKRFIAIWENVIPIESFIWTISALTPDGIPENTLTA